MFPLKSFLVPQSDSLAPSMTEQVITQLRRIDPPFVIITPEFTTERSPKGKCTVTLCHKVGADYVLVGAISGTAGQARVTVRLLNCRAQACLWAENYTVPLDTLFAGQEEISREIARSVVRSIPFPLRPSHLQLVFPLRTSYLRRDRTFSLGSRKAQLRGAFLSTKMRFANVLNSPWPGRRWPMPTVPRCAWE